MEANEFYLEKHLDKDASTPLILGIFFKKRRLQFIFRYIKCICYS